MFRSMAVMSVAALVIAFAPVARAADEPKDVIAKAIKAHGGEELLTKQKAGQTKSKGKLDLPGVGEVDYSQDIMYMLPNKFKDQMELKVMGQTINVLTIINGDKVTLEVNGNAIDQTDKVKDAVADMANVMEAARLVNLKDKAFELSTIGEDKVGDKKVVGVRVAKKGQKDVSLYFDKETGLLAKLEFRTTDQATGNEVTEERLPSDYAKNKDGVLAPRKIVVKRDGKAFLDAEITETKYFEKLDDSEFKK
ncbi:hypothetical protein R5W23_004097 [Gemmata sp. JC673]|uniref:Outer membrane lipoprotein carrier protein LolA n=1 Tax=Gemmata algarum TaxID=2975278 RepID=A0ABU5F9W2_9BACT|nr:hypothetical protein [Gemmata algarum]MDY3562631.1 hypothetical protein [Gemmata algarum]